MRTISEQFKELQDELIRPQMELYFEIGSNDLESMSASPDSNLGLDDTVAPAAAPDNCLNERYYAIVGDGMPVDDPNRICAPDNTGDIAEPDGSVPYGVSPYTSPNSYFVLEGEDFYDNFAGFNCPVTLCFLGGHIPSEIVVEIYDSDNDSWSAEATIDNHELSKTVKFDAADYSQAAEFRRFKLKSTGGGRFILNWLRRDKYEPVIFRNTLISSATIDQETDLTSQTLPSYEMTVEVLDVDEIYTPDSTHWKKQFVDGAPCLFKCGFEINGEIEYIPLFYGTLAKAPDYNEGKITFNAEITWRTNWYVNEFWSLVNHDISTGDLVDDRTFENYIWTTDLFDDYSDAFADQDDSDASVCNYYGEVNSNEVRQLVANALGCFITAGIGTIDLHNANNIQYKPIGDYLTRYEQIQATLESQPKVGKIVVARNENRLSANSFQQEVAERVYCRPDEAATIIYKVPFYAIGKFIVNDYQKSVPTAAIQADYGRINEEVNEDGTATVELVFTVSANTYIKPIVTFYGVDNTRFEETSYTDNEAGENYENDNMLITNSYTAEKARRVAHLVNDTNCQYQVDLMQNFQYELGDTVRLEMKDGSFKTCVITGLQFVLPGSAGRLTCRKIFNTADDENAILDAVGTTVHLNDDSYVHTDLMVAETDGSPCVFALTFDRVNDKGHWVVLGGTEYETWIENGAHTQFSPNLTVTDKNGHVWEFGYISSELHGGGSIGDYYFFDYQSDEYAQLDNALAWTAITLIKTLYENQGMTPPVDYECEYMIT